MDVSVKPPLLKYYKKGFLWILTGDRNVFEAYRRSCLDYWTSRRQCFHCKVLNDTTFASGDVAGIPPSDSAKSSRLNVSEGVWSARRLEKPTITTAKIRQQTDGFVLSLSVR